MRPEKALSISIFSLQVLFVVVLLLVGYSTIATAMASLPSGDEQEGGMPLDLTIEKEATGGLVVALAFPVHNKGLLPLDIGVKLRFQTQAGQVLVDEEGAKQIPAGHSDEIGLSFTITREKLEQVLAPNTRIEGILEYKTLYGLVSASASVQSTTDQLRPEGG